MIFDNRLLFRQIQNYAFLRGGYCKLFKLLILVSTPLIPINTKSTSIDYQVIDILMRLP